MSRRRDEEDAERWARQDREKRERLSAWLATRSDGGVPPRIPLEHARLLRVDKINDAFWGNDVGGEIETPGEVCVLFKAKFARGPRPWETDWSTVESIEVRQHLVGDPRHSWYDWQRLCLSEEEDAHLKSLIVSTMSLKRQVAADDERCWREQRRADAEQAASIPENIANRRSITSLLASGYDEFEMRRQGFAKVGSDGGLVITQHGHMMAGAFKDIGSKMGTRHMSPWGIRMRVT